MRLLLREACFEFVVFQKSCTVNKSEVSNRSHRHGAFGLRQQRTRYRTRSLTLTLKVHPIRFRATQQRGLLERSWNAPGTLPSGVGRAIICSRDVGGYRYECVSWRSACDVSQACPMPDGYPSAVYTTFFKNNKLETRLAQWCSRSN